MRAAPRVRVLAFHCITWSLVVAVSVFAAEVLLRMSGRVTVESVATAREEVFDSIPGIFEPGQKVIEQPRPELRHRVSINSFGYRGPEIDADNRSGRIRLMCLGDSFTYGSYVDDDHTLPAQLERALRETGYPVDVINAGVGGTTIVDQLYVLKKGARLDVDIVLLVFSENDISDLAKDEPLYRTVESNRRLKAKTGVRQVYSLIKNTALFNLAVQARGWYRARTTNAADLVDRSAAIEKVERLWNRYDVLLGEMQAYLAARNLTFVFVIFPSHYRLDSHVRSDDRIERVEGLAIRRGVRTINLLEPLRAAGYGPSGLYLLPHDGHPSARGYAVAARTIARQLGIDVREVAGARGQRGLSGDHQDWFSAWASPH